ncbi:TetR/AcrR family transcriptional regulator [Jiangella alba]|uniref:DNA-binding transcriptional regulator, AcrR family n=1 Tax=Jiangella alba TaxID=561176 RepID=A0A1H5JSV4_9ACTN|nr:TetR/AcrR family transcriptional regulator [Jiangella alba]SEE55576.1 DNA-binding transcriptional regulator, AcrR family [Jiangella alba]
MTTTDTGVRQRTRRAILDAAVALWARDFSASLGDIADRAEVSRSTLHRYFPERQSLVDALLIDSQARLGEAWGAAVAASSAPIETIENIMGAIVDLADHVLFLFSDPDRFEGNPHWDDSDDDTLPDLIRAAQSSGDLDPAIDPTFVIGVMYSLIYVTAESVSAGTLPRHKATDTLVRVFRHGLSPRPS